MLRGVEQANPATTVQAGRTVSLPQLLSVDEAAAYLRLDASTVRRHLRNGELPGTQIGGRWYISAAALAERFEGAA